MITTSIWTYVRKSIAALSVVALGVGIFGNAAQAIADRLDRERQFEIPAQPLATALVQFSKQAEMQLVTSSTELGSRETRGISGQISIRRALESLLDRTGLTYSLVGENTVAIVQEGTPPRKIADAVSAALEGPASIRLAQVENASSRDNTQREATSSDSPEEQKTSTQRSQDRLAPEDLGEIVVTGTNIRGVYPSSSPVDIYTAEDIERSGATTTEEFIEKLPQNFAFTSDNAPASFVGGATTVNGNLDAVNSPDLHGLGVGTTLTLLNGRRLALANEGRGADISMIPVGALARVEVLTDGASAIYGSDAIGGVVNFVLRDDFEGAETRLRYGGVTSGNLRQGTFSQMFGGAWESGYGIVSYDFQDASALESADRPYLEESDSISNTNLTPITQRHGLLFTGGQDFGERLSVDSVLAMSRREVENRQSTTSDTSTARILHVSDTDQFFANVGANYAITDPLNLSVVATYTKNDVDRESLNETTGASGLSFSEHSALDLTTTLDGPLFAIPGGDVRFVFGADYLDEDYSASNSGLTGSASGRTLGRITTAAFGELFIPLLGDRQNIALAHRLELSLAGRYTRHEDDSDPPLEIDHEGFSPKIGMLWAPFRSLGLRATWGESFRAPTVSQTDPTGTTGVLNGSTAIQGTPQTTLQLFGPALPLEPEEAETYTIGFDFRPASLPGFHLSATYYNIDYVDRIGTATTIPARAAPDSWPEIIHHPSSAAEIEELLGQYSVISNNTGIGLGDLRTASEALFARLPNMWILDERTRNLSISRQEGFDLSIGHQFEGSWGRASIGANVSRILSFEQQATVSSPVVSVVDTVLQPVSFRGRIQAGLSRGGFTTTLNANYVDDYANPFARDASSARTVESWTTLDWTATYEFTRDARGGFLDGVRLSFTVQNVFDQVPPLVFRTAGTTPNLSNSPGYDPANANPLGRVVSLGIAKHW